jgi:hypothetical protein
MDTSLVEGYRVSGGVVNVVAVTAATAATIFRVSNYADQIGTKSFKLRKLTIRNNGAGNGFVHIGNGTVAPAPAYVDRIPPVYTLTNQSQTWETPEIPLFESFIDVTAYADAVGAGSFDIMIEGEEIG